jgi:hypothetical protein
MLPDHDPIAPGLLRRIERPVGPINELLQRQYTDMCSMCHTQANGERDNPPIGQNREVGQALTQALCHVVIHLLEVVDEVRHKFTIHHCRRTELRTEIRLPSGSSSLVAYDISAGLL